MNYKIINKFSFVTFLVRKNPNIFSALKSLVNFMSPAWFIFKKKSSGKYENNKLCFFHLKRIPFCQEGSNDLKMAGQND